MKPRSDLHATWRRRPLLSLTLRVIAFAGPIAVSLVVATAVTALLPRVTSWQVAVLWLLVSAAASLAALVLLERAARHLLPLAALLNVSLVFPDGAPKRFAIARRSGNPKDLRAKIEAARRAGHAHDAAGLQAVVDLVLALSVHDKATRGHSERVRVYADMIAAELKIDALGRARLPWAALLHDVGKLLVPDAILNKPGAPTDAEWKVLHRHPEEGARIVASLLPWLGPWGAAVEQHHERYDGTGYPRGLTGEEISLAARIVSVADTYEVMTAPRAYKRAMSPTAARTELARVAGSQLDPMVVRAFLNISLGRLWRTVGIGAWLGQVPALLRVLTMFGRLGTVGAQGVAVVAAGAVMTASGIIGPLPVQQHPTSAFNSSAAVDAAAFPGAGTGHGSGASGSAGGPSQAVPPTPSAAGAAASPSTSGTSSSSTGSPGPTTPGGGQSSQGTSRPQASSGATPGPTSAATPAPSATPTATPATPAPTSSSTPQPTPDPWSCAACTNTSQSCTSYCRNNNANACLTYCDGNNNSACTSHCFGNNNSKCTTYCWGSNNPKCQSNCNNSGYTGGGASLPEVLVVAMGSLLLRRRLVRRLASSV